MQHLVTKNNSNDVVKELTFIILNIFSQKVFFVVLYLINKSFSCHLLLCLWLFMKLTEEEMYFIFVLIYLAFYLTRCMTEHSSVTLRSV